MSPKQSRILFEKFFYKNIDNYKHFGTLFIMKEGQKGTF